MQNFSNNGYFLLNFIKITVNSKNKNSNYFFLTNNFFILNSINYLEIFYKNQIINNLFNCKVNSKKNNYLIFKNNNKFKNFILNFKYLFKLKFKYNRLFNYIYFQKKTKNTVFGNYNYLNNYLKFNYFKYYFKYFFKNWNFLIGFTLSSFYYDLSFKKISINKLKSFKLFKNRYFFIKNLKTKNKFYYIKRIRKFNFLNNKNYTKKYIINNFFYIKNFNINFKYTSNKFILKNNNPLFLKKKNYNLFLSKPYLFLNTYKNIKLNKSHSNYFLIFLYKKYFKFFNVLKRVNFSIKNKKTNNLFFKRIIFNPDYLSKSYRNKSLNIYLNLKSKLPLFKKDKFNFQINLKKKLIFFWFFKIIFCGKILKKNKFLFNYKFFLNKKLKSIKASRRSRKKLIFIKSFIIFKKLNNYKFSLIKYKKHKNVYKYKYKNLKYKNNTNLFIKFKIKYNKLKLKLYFYKKNYKNILEPFLFLKKIKKFNEFKWKNIIVKRIISLKKNFIYFNKKILFFKKNLKFSNIYKKIKKPFYITKTKVNFLLKNYGFLFINTNLNQYLNNTSFLYNTKKLMYTFSYKNEIQKFILRKYIKNNHIKDLYFKNSLFNNLTNIVYLNNNNNNFNYHDNLNNNNSYFNFFNSFLNKNNQLQTFITKNTSMFDNWTYYYNQSLYFKKNYNDESDFNIKRVRFKPGYMTIWRDVRKVLKDSLSLNFKYQHKLTNFLTKYNKFINFKTYLFLEMKLINVLMKSKLINDNNISNIFLKNNLIYVNGMISNNPNLQIFIGDFIQIIIHLKYYILIKWFLNLNIKKKNKIKNIFRKKNPSSLYSDEKKKSYNIPKWILFNKNLFEDCPSYLESDFFTLSTFIIYEPFMWSDINPYNILDQKFSIINLYNWKYIN